jgi:hypothetical protein
MAQVRKCFLALACASALQAQKFYPDDPIAREPAPLPVAKPLRRSINEYYDFFLNTFEEPAREQKPNPGPSQGVNTLGEVYDSAWFTNRIGSRPMSIEELQRGPGTSQAPCPNGPWTVLSGKNEGVTPGLVVRDCAGRKYFLKFDPKSNPNMASAADVLGSKLFYAIGYNVPENYFVTFDRSVIVVSEESKYRDPSGRERRMKNRDVDDVLDKVPRDREGRYRGMASLTIPGDPIGPFKYAGTRRDDPNDVIPHESRRDLRGLYVFAAWLNHTDTKSLNSQDSVVEENGLRYVRHFLIDFGAILGSDSFEPKSPRAGNVYLFDFKPSAWQFLSLGFYVPGWMRADYPHLRELGHFEADTFDPEHWKNNYPNPAFDLRLPGDTFWAAKKVMAFRDEDIRAIVATARFDDPQSAEWLTRCLIERRDKIGRAFFDDVLPLDHFEVRQGSLTFEDLAVKYGFHPQREYSVQWYQYDNRNSRREYTITGATSMQLPRLAAPYLAAEIRSGDKMLTVYVHDGRVVGIDR